MTQWMAFDEESTAVAASHTKAAVLFQRGDALGSALASGRNGVVILPTNQGDRLTLLRLRRNVPTIEGEPVTYEPTGFLGLTDRINLEQQPEPSKKWWRRILD